MQTEHLILRQLLQTDFDDFFEIISNNRIVDDMTPVTTKVQAQKLLDESLTLAKNNKKFTFSLILKETKKMIGFIELVLKDKITGELSCIVNSNYWNKGYGSEAMMEIQKFALEKMQLKRLCGVCNLFNYACSNLFKYVLGFEYKKTEQIDGKDYLFFEMIKK